LDLANVLRLSSRYEESISVLDGLLARQAMLPSGHPDPLRTRMRRTVLLRRVGRVEEALEDSLLVLQEFERIYGRDSVSTAFAHRSVGAAYVATGRDGDALPHMERDLEIITLRLGPDHREALRAQHNLAYMLGQSNDPARQARALALFAECISRASRAFGPEHPTMAAFRASQAALLLRLGRLADAMESLLAAGMEQALVASSEGVRKRVNASLSEILDRSDCRFPSNRGMGLERERLTEELPLIRSAACVPRNGDTPVVARNSD
jgi:tetratricopeptide (TPR) repeat protein